MSRRELPAYEVLYRRGRLRPALWTGLALLAVLGLGAAAALLLVGDGARANPAEPASPVLVAAVLVPLAGAVLGLLAAARGLRSALRDRAVTVYGDPSGIVLADRQSVGPIPWRYVSAIRPVERVLFGGVAIAFHRPQAVFEAAGEGLSAYRRGARGQDQILIRRSLLDVRPRRAAEEMGKMWEMYR